MTDLNTNIVCDKVAIMPLTPKFAADLVKYRELGGKDCLNQGLIYHISQSIHFRPRSTRLVAYHKEDNLAIGFLALKENTDKIHLIEDVFVHPDYRKIGVATRLFNYAFALAKQRGAKKIHLNVYTTNINAQNLYKKLGFAEVGRTTMAQLYLLESVPSRIIKRVLIGQGFLTKLSHGKTGQLAEMNMNSKINREKLFSIYQKCIQQDMVDFFEINADNFINGTRSVWQPPFFRHIMINDSFNSFVLIFNCPFSYKATVEVYTTSNSFTPYVVEDLLKILANRGTTLVQITLFRPSIETINWLEEKGMIFHFVSMGKKLD